MVVTCVAYAMLYLAAAGLCVLAAYGVKCGLDAFVDDGGDDPDW